MRNRLIPLVVLVISTFLSIIAVRTACSATAGDSPRVLALVNGTLIDGSGGDPLPDAVLLIRGGRIAAAGKRSAVTVPEGAETIDLGGGTILPGFFNAHVHDGFQPSRLQAWLQAGVTSVVDMGLRPGQAPRDMVIARDGALDKPEYARVFTAGPMITVPNGYGLLFVTSPADARQKVLALLDDGVDLIKISQEDGYAGMHGLPKLSDEMMAAIVSSAHNREKRVAAHITQAAYLEIALRAGSDIIAHVPYDYTEPAVLEAAARKGVYLTPTFSVFRSYGAPIASCMRNLSVFVLAGGKVALGSDFNGGPGEFEQGIPMYEIECMRDAGMTPLQIIVAATRNAAWVCGRENQLGTLEPGKIADVLVVGGDPLRDLHCLREVRLVLKGGVVVVDRR